MFGLAALVKLYIVGLGVFIQYQQVWFRNCTGLLFTNVTSIWLQVNVVKSLAIDPVTAVGAVKMQHAAMLFFFSLAFLFVSLMYGSHSAINL